MVAVPEPNQQWHYFMQHGIFITAKVSGDIYHETLQVDEGATIEGRIARLDSKKAKEKDKVAALRAASSA